MATILVQRRLLHRVPSTAARHLKPETWLCPLHCFSSAAKDISRKANPNSNQKISGENRTSTIITKTRPPKTPFSPTKSILKDESCWKDVHPDILPHLKRCDSSTDEPPGKSYLRKDSGFHLFFFGTGSGTCKRRHSSCTLLRMGAEGMVFDAGEGCQSTIKTSIVKFKKISRIFITHMHGDHVMGLPGLLLSANIANVDEEDDAVVQVYGPPGATLMGWLRLKWLERCTLTFLFSCLVVFRYL